MTEFEKLVGIIARLRAKDGCPWDSTQTHETLKPCCIEEACEVICGMNILRETGNGDNLKEELGDLLMQVILNSLIAQEEGLFSLDDVIAGISEKMIRRHPGIFTEQARERYGDDIPDWNTIKKLEKEDREIDDMQYLPQAFSEAEELIGRARKRKGLS